jgi:hypothetical protein
MKLPIFPITPGSAPAETRFKTIMYYNKNLLGFQLERRIEESIEGWSLLD